MLAVGLMSGTSLDGVDCALVEIEGVDRQTTVALREFMTYPMPTATKLAFWRRARPAAAIRACCARCMRSWSTCSRVQSAQCVPRRV